MGSSLFIKFSRLISLIYGNFLNMKREKMVGTFSGTLTEALFNRLLDDDVSLIQFVDSYG